MEISKALTKVIKEQKSSLHDFKIFCGLLLHQLNPVGTASDEVDANVLRVLASLVQIGRECLTHVQFSDLKRYLLADRAELLAVARQNHSPAILEGMFQLNYV